MSRRANSFFPAAESEVRSVRTFIMALLACGTLALTGCHLWQRRVECERHGGGRWHEVTTEHFRIRTDADPELVLGEARRFEVLRAHLLRYLAGPRVRLDSRLEVILLRDAAALDEFASLVGGYFTQLEWTQYIVTSGHEERGPGTYAYRNFQHELVHALGASLFPGMPRWFSEGLAQFLERARFDEQGRFMVGTSGAYMLEFVRYQGRQPIANLFAAESKADSDPYHQQSHYATSWLAVHYLALARGEGLARYLVGLHEGKPTELAWSAAFPGLDPAALDSELSAYVNTALRAKVFDWPSPEVSPPSIAPLGAADVHHLRALVWMTRGKKSADPGLAAQREIELALAEDPGHLEARIFQLRLLHDPQLRGRAMGELLVRHPESPQAWLQFSRAAELRGDPVARLAAVQRGAANAQRDPEVQFELGELYLALGEVRKASAHAAAAVRLAPWQAQAHRLHARALAASGDCGGSQRSLNSALEHSRADFWERRRALAALGDLCRKVPRSHGR
jgi:hypothetical protein